MKMIFVDFVLITVLIICFITDVKSRKIYNKVIFPCIPFAFMAHFFVNGWNGVGSALLGFLLGLAILIIPYLLGGMGAGDVKLLALIGAFKGSSFVLTTAFYMALVGGLIAIVIILFQKGKVKELIYHFWAKKHGAELPIDKKLYSTTYPYGVAIVAGALFALYSQETLILW
jgi:prepilin peptidase CpaA